MSNGRFINPKGDKNIGGEHSVVSLLAEIRDEVREFLQTRVLMLRSEIQEKTAALKPVVPLLGLAALLAVTAYLLLTFALVAAVSVILINQPYHWALAFLIVGSAWLLLGLIFGAVALSKLRNQELAPVKTIRVLKADKIWIESEAKQPL